MHRVTRSWVVVVLLAGVASAGSNAPEGGQRRAEEEVLPKLNPRCGVTLKVRYDAASLKAKNKDIGWDQTDGHLVCDEPLRLLWLLCGTDEGRAAVRKAELREVVCRGTGEKVGALTVQAGVITVDRAYEERDAFLRARTQLEAALGVKVPVVTVDPYRDEAWREFRRAPAPVTSTTDYCLVNGEKRALDLDEVEHVRGEATVKCLEGGKVVVDVTVKDRKKTGLTTWARDERRRVQHWRDGREDGLSEERERGVLLSQVQWRQGERVWWKEWYPSGKLKSYRHQYPGRLVSLDLREDGQVTGLDCAPEVKDDEVLAPWCGFRGEKSVVIYDGTGKVNLTVTFRAGQRTKQVAGDSAYAGSTVAFVDGKKDGEERVTRRDGTLEATVTWRRGEQHGPERRYSEDGKKVVETREWRDGALVKRTESFLNGNAKRVETHDGEKTMRVVESYDLGQVRHEGAYVRCAKYRGWCEDGLHVEYFEDGKRSAETTWREGKRVGPAKTWFSNGKPRSEDEYADDRLVKRRAWDEQGALVADDEFEADGSRKVKR